MRSPRRSSPDEPVGRSLPSFFRLAALRAIGSTNDEAKRARGRRARRKARWSGRWQQTAGRGRPGQALGLARRAISISRCAAARRCPSRRRRSSASPRRWPSPRRARGFCRRQAAIGCKWPNDVLVDGAQGRRHPARIAEPRRTAVDWLVRRHRHQSRDLSRSRPNIRRPRWPRPARRRCAGDARRTGRASSSPGTSAGARRRLRAVRAAWLARADGLGQPIRVRLPSETATGVSPGSTTDGALLLDSAEAAARRIAAGDVFPAGGARGVDDAARHQRQQHQHGVRPLGRRPAAWRVAHRDRSAAHRRRICRLARSSARARRAVARPASTARSSPASCPRRISICAKFCRDYCRSDAAGRGRARASSSASKALVDRPDEVGADRLVNTVAAHDRYPGAADRASISAPRRPSTWSTTPAITAAASSRRASISRCRRWHRRRRSCRASPIGAHRQGDRHQHRRLHAVGHLLGLCRADRGLVDAHQARNSARR